MIWSDRKIKENSSIIEPFNEELLQPNSYDVTIDKELWIKLPEIVETNSYGTVRTYPSRWIHVDLPYTITTDIFVLASTKEKFTLPNGVVAQVDGKSTLARKGLLVHISSGWIDSGFSGHITMEMRNLGNTNITIEEGMKIGQVIFMDAYESDKVYGECNNHYQNQNKATKSWMDEQ